MPYTPPSQRSPAASRTDSPPRSRDGSWVKPLPSSSPFVSSPGARPALPRSSSSTSYLHRHRRSPSTPTTSLSCSSLDESAKEHGGSALKASASIRQSPPPLNNLTIPSGAVMSPPDSGQNSSDDELLVMSDRGRRLDNLAELQAAIEHIEQAREMSPMREAETNMARNALTLNTNPKEAVKLQLPSGRPPLSKEARKISHSRSATDTNAYVSDNGRSSSYSPPGSSSDSELDDEAVGRKPPMLRKKSGELVRPALRPPSARRRPSSMPGTPTFGKAVHFSNDLEHVRHFLQVDRPLAVSAETSPVETYESETEFPFQSGDASRTTYEWDIRMANFPADMSDKPPAPINVERVFLSPDKKTLIGTAAVQNLAFHKAVIARFTFDYWKTTSEVSAEFSQDARRTASSDGLDRFNFQIRLADQVNLESKTLFFCVRYSVAGQEFWDSNHGMNYQVDFSKKAIPAPVKAKPAAPANEATRHINGLPRSRSPRQSPNKTTFDDFGRGFDTHWDKELLPRTKSASSILSMDEGATPIKFRNKASGNGVPAPLGRKAKQNPNQPFGHRYDFGASLTAAISAASTALGERSGLPQKASSPNPAFIPNGNGSPQQDDVKPTALTTEKPPAQSQSYNELLEKYCFFGTKGSPAGSNSPTQGNVTAGTNLKPKFYLDGNDSGSRTPSPAQTPPVENVQAGVGLSSAEPAVHVASPKISSRAASPSFGYPYHQAMTNGLPASTAIHG